MKSIYNKNLSKAERHRVSDALYRLRKEGFYIPKEKVKYIKDASSYQAIYEKATSLKGAYYQPTRTTGEKMPAKVPGKLAYEVVQEQKKYERERQRLIKKGRYGAEDIPEFKPQALGPSVPERKRMTKEQVQEATVERFKKVSKTLKKYTPSTYLQKRKDVTTENLLKVMRTTVRPYSKKTYDAIAKVLRNMSPDEFMKMYDIVGKDVFDALFIYFPSASKTGVMSDAGEIVQPIYTFLEAIGLDVNMEVEAGLTIAEIIELI